MSLLVSDDSFFPLSSKKETTFFVHRAVTIQDIGKSKSLSLLTVSTPKDASSFF